MKLQMLEAGNQNVITGYGEGYVSINTQRYTSSVIVAPNRTVAAWDVHDFAALEPVHLQNLIDLKPEIVLLGTGRRQQLPRPELMRVFVDARVGFEAMDTGAACRTYNVLMSEGREVLAAILL